MLSRGARVIGAAARVRVAPRVAAAASRTLQRRGMSSTPITKAKMQKAKSTLNLRTHPTAEVMSTANQLCEKAALGDLAGVRALVSAGANVNAVDYDFRSCLHIAAANGHLELVEWLCANGAQQVRHWRQLRGAVTACGCAAA